MQVTTESIIKMLPFDTEFKKQLLDGWNTFSSDQKYEITMMLWDTYSAVYELTYEKNYQEALLLAQNDKEKMDKGLSDRIKAKTDQELEQMGSVQSATVDLSSTREALTQIINQTPTSDPQTNASD